MMRCAQCNKEIEFGEILITCDGDFVCNKKCETRWFEEMTKVINMTDNEFYSWMGVV